MELTSLKISLEIINATEPNETTKGTFLRINKWWAKQLKVSPKENKQ